MKTTILLFVVISVYYTTGLSVEDYDLKELKDDPTRFDVVANCLVSKGECNELDGKLKENLGGLVTSKCSECNSKVKQIYRDLASLLLTRRPDVVLGIELALKDPESVKQLLDILEPIPSAVGLPPVSRAGYEEAIERLTKKAN